MACARIRRLTLTNFRSYHSAQIEVGAGPVVLVGPNGAGKTNLIEAISFLAPVVSKAQGLLLARRAPHPHAAALFIDWALSEEGQTYIGIDMVHLPTIYLVSGLFSIVTGPLVGRASDAFGKYPTFVFGCVMTIIMVLIYTHLGHVSLATAITVNVLMFVGIFSRMIPSQALMSAIPDQSQRGSFRDRVSTRISQPPTRSSERRRDR